MGVMKPLSILAAGTGGPAGFGLVAAGFAVAGFLVGSWSANRGRDRQRVAFFDAREKVPAGDEVVIAYRLGADAVSRFH
jgi:hypothetical protein